LTEIPSWVLIAVGVASIVQIVVLLIVGGVLALVASNLIATMSEVKDIVQNDVHKEIMPQVTAITKNVKVISDDAATTTHHVTGTVNHISHVVNSVTQKLESPMVKSVGVLTGVMAGAKALSGGKKARGNEKKRGGLLGFLGR
jgi:subtilase family serine protease